MHLTAVQGRRVNSVLPRAWWSHKPPPWGTVLGCRGRGGHCTHWGACGVEGCDALCHGGAFSTLSSQNPSARMAPCSQTDPKRGSLAPRPQRGPWFSIPKGGPRLPIPKGVLLVHITLWWALCFGFPDAPSILGTPCAALVAQGMRSSCARGAAGALNKRLFFFSISILTPFSLAPLARPRASVCVPVSDPQQAAALPPSEGAPLVRRGCAAQTGLLFPAAESCQAWLPSQKAALLQNISSYCLRRCELCWSREGRGPRAG